MDGVRVSAAARVRVRPRRRLGDRGDGHVRLDPRLEGQRRPGRRRSPVLRVAGTSGSDAKPGPPPPEDRALSDPPRAAAVAARTRSGSSLVLKSYAGDQGGGDVQKLGAALAGGVTVVAICLALFAGVARADGVGPRTNVCDVQNLWGGFFFGTLPLDQG